MSRQDTKAVSTALTGALGSKNTTYNSKQTQHYNAKLSLVSLCLKYATVRKVTYSFIRLIYIDIGYRRDFVCETMHICNV